MIKKSISLKGHRTSIALEAAFWRVLETAAARRGVSLPQLVVDIDEARVRAGPTTGLASALRLFALETAEAGSRGDDLGVSDQTEARPTED